MGSRRAVVIGVDKTGGLPLLRGAAADAERVAAWLEGEGFDVTLLSDTKDARRASGEVTASEVLRAIGAIVDDGTCVQLVVYFAGHGLNNFGTEIWLLSRAPQAAHEAINLAACVDLARDCGIQSVCFISDACRSNPTAGPMRRVTGVAIFPNTPAPPGARAKVDRLLPTTPNAAANEVDETIDDVMRRGGIFTTELLRAHGVPSGDGPPALDAERELVGVARRDGQDTRVVDLSRLAAWLEERVPLAAAARGIAWPQQPECIVETPPRDKFLGRALFPARGCDSPYPPSAESVVMPYAAVPADPAWLIDTLTTRRRSTRSLPERLQEDLRRTAAEIHAADQIGRSAPNTGVQVTGERVIWAAGIGLRAEPPAAPDEPWALTGLSPRTPAGSVMVEFSGGTGTVVAGLRGTVASIRVNNGGVANVSYVPSRFTSRSDGSGELRAEVAAEVRHGVFRPGADGAAAFVERIRLMPHIDPTICLYAAYAWRDAGRPDEIQAIVDRMRAELAGTLLSDLALLAARGTPEARSLLSDSVPFCPLLMRGWSFLRASGVPILADILRAADHLVPALWTTFDAEGVRILRDAIEHGRLR